MGLYWMVNGAVQRDHPLATRASSHCTLYTRTEERTPNKVPSRRPPRRQSLDPAEQVRVSEVMSRELKILPALATVDEGLTLLDEFGFNHIPLVDDEGRLSGLVSDRDLYRGLTYPDAPLADFMTTRLVTSMPSTFLKDAARVLMAEKISSLPVIDAEQKPVGLVTMADVLGYLVSHPAMELWG